METEIFYNQNCLERFIPLRTVGSLEGLVLNELRGQEQGVVLCDLGSEFVTWKIYRHDDWKNCNHGNYFRVSSYSDNKEAYNAAFRDFLERAKDLQAARP